MKTYRAILIYGEGVARLCDSVTEFLNVLRKEKEQNADSFRNTYHLKQSAFGTEIERDAYVNGVKDMFDDNNENVVCIFNETVILDFIDLFEQKALENTSVTYPGQVKELASRLNDIINSRWIPFASPAPSSTESAIKRSLLSAKNYLDYTITLLN